MWEGLGGFGRNCEHLQLFVNIWQVWKDLVGFVRICTDLG